MSMSLPITDELKAAARTAEAAIGSIPWERLKEHNLMEVKVQFVSREACADWQNDCDLVACSSGDEPSRQIQKSQQFVNRCKDRHGKLQDMLNAVHPPLTEAVTSAMQKVGGDVTQAITELNASIGVAYTDSRDLPGDFRRLATRLNDIRSRHIQLEQACNQLEQAVHKHLLTLGVVQSSAPPLMRKPGMGDSVSVPLDTLFAGPWLNNCQTISQINTALTDLPVDAGTWELLPIHIEVLNSPKMIRWEIEYAGVLPDGEGDVIQKAVEGAIQGFVGFLKLADKALKEPVPGLLPETANSLPSLTGPAAKRSASGQGSVRAKRPIPEYFVTMAAAAKYAKVSKRTIQNWKDSEWLDVEQKGRKIRIARANLDKCMKRQ
jgi:hypothetical protein